MAPSQGKDQPRPGTLLERHAWLIYVLPMAVYMLGGSFEPSLDEPGGKILGLAIPYSAYPLVYTLKIALTVVSMALVFPGYRQFRRPPGLPAVVVGAVGIVVWVGLWYLAKGVGLTDLIARIPGCGHGRPAYNPLAELAATPGWAWTFLAIRFFGLVAVVPVIEEFFLRGFLMRMVMHEEWWKSPIGDVNAAAVALSIVVPVLTHPGEALAAAAWFGMVTWLMVRTRNLWDCVVAHAVTNLLLGIYVVTWQQWSLW